ncbi:MAG: DUF4214 domain-containing protein [Pseudomonadota bacterium]
MAKLIAFRPLDMLETELTSPEVTRSTSSVYEITSVSFVAILYGNFTYDASGNVLGRVTSFEGFLGGALWYRLTDIDEDASFAAQELLSGDVWELQRSALSEVDEVYGSAGDDVILSFDSDDVVHAEQGDDHIFTGRGADIAHGGPGDDAFSDFPDGGPDQYFGGKGEDIVYYDGPFGNYAFEVHRGEFRLTDVTTGMSDWDRLTSIESVYFFEEGGYDSDNLFNIGNFTGIAQLSAREIETFVEMYIAYFNRAPDAPGLFYWGTRLNDGMSLPEIAASFFVQPESKAAFPNPDNNAALVDAAYWNLLERAPDAAGRQYWIDALAAGDVSRPEFMLALINGARANPDATQDVRTVEAKADIGIYYAVTNGLSDVDNAAAVMEGFERSDPGGSRLDAKQMIDVFRADAMDGQGEMEATMRLVGVVDDPFALI